MKNIEEVFQNQVQELRRGSIVLAIVSVLHDKTHYGYSLQHALEGQAFSVDESTLYPLLRRLEKQGVLSSEWSTADNHPRKYYTLTPEGKQFYQKLLAEWLEMNRKLKEIIKE